MRTNEFMSENYKVHLRLKEFSLKIETAKLEGGSGLLNSLPFYLLAFCILPNQSYPPGNFPEIRNFLYCVILLHSRS